MKLSHRLGARNSVRERRSASPVRLRTKDADLKERLRRRAEGEWDKAKKASNEMSKKYKAQDSRNWPSKEELLFGFNV